MNWSIQCCTDAAILLYISGCPRLERRPNKSQHGPWHLWQTRKVGLTDPPKFLSECWWEYEYWIFLTCLTGRCPWCWKLLIRAKLTLPATASWCVAWWGEVLVCLCRVHCFTSEQYYRPGSNRKLLCARKGQGCTFGKMKWTRIVDVTRN